MPGAQCTRSLVRASGSKYAHEYSQRKHRKHPASPTQWFYGFFRALPGDHRFVDPVIRATRWRRANLTPASGRQNHTASPSAAGSARLTLRRVHRIPPRARDDRVSPLCRDGTGESILLIFRRVKKYFCKSEDGVRGAIGLESSSIAVKIRHRAIMLTQHLTRSAARPTLRRSPLSPGWLTRWRSTGSSEDGNE